ncbi:MAG: hypothetical protein ACI37T_02030 [Candidatus Gastranaerophilaceae bacterium]
MKKIILTFALFMYTALGAFAETLIGVAMSNFSTENPSSGFAVKIQEDFSLDNIKTYKAGTIFYGNVTKVVHGQIGKRKGYFEFVPTHFVDKNGTYELYRRDLSVKVSFYKPFNKDSAKSLAESGITTAAGMIFNVPFVSQGVSFVKGVYNPEGDENRVISGFKKVYKDSPVSYIEKGDEFYVHIGQEVKLKIGDND